jgi:hypothetical protein
MLTTSRRPNPNPNPNPNGRKLSVLVLALGLVSALPGAALAQIDEPAPWVHLRVVQVDPVMVDDFVAVQREFTELAKKAKVPWRSVSRTEVFGDTYRFLIATPAQDLASFGESNDAPELASLVDRAERCITSRKSYAIRVIPQLANPLPVGKQPELMLVNFVDIAPGREKEYVDVMSADFFPHFNEANSYYVTGSRAIGGTGGFVHVFYVDDFAALDEGSPVVRALGAEGAEAVTEKLAGIVTSSELWLARLLPELSYGPEAETESESLK